MARTSVLPTDPQTRKAWNMRVASDSIKDQYWAKHIGPEGSNSMVVRKTDLEKGAGDEVTTTLVAKLRGAPVTSGQKLAGKEMKLDFATHKMRIDVIRQGVNVGTKMDQKRVDMDLMQQGRDRLKDYISELYEEHFACAAAGARGVSTTEFQHLGLDYTGYPNPLRAPDAGHLFIGTDGSKVKNTLVSGDKITLTTLNQLQVKAKKMLGGIQDGKSAKIEMIKRDGQEVYVMVCMPEVVQDLRNDSGTQGWFAAQTALTTALGKESDLYKGGAGMFNKTCIDSCDVGVKFSDYGAGANVLAARSIFAGANCLAVTHGTKGMKDGMSVVLSEDSEDRGYEDIVNFMLIFGVDKTAYAGLDYGMISVDTAYTLASGATI